MALTSLHWQQPYARLQVSNTTLAAVGPSRAPRFSARDNFTPADNALEKALLEGGHSPAWFSDNLGAKLWRMISHQGRLFMYLSPTETEPKPDGQTQEAARTKLGQSLAPLGTLELRMASSDNCCGGACRGCVETQHSSHQGTWSLPVLPSTDGTSPKEPRLES